MGLGPGGLGKLPNHPSSKVLNITSLLRPVKALLPASLKLRRTSRRTLPILNQNSLPSQTHHHLLPILPFQLADVFNGNSDGNRSVPARSRQFSN